MNVTIENVAACRKKLNIEVPLDEVSREWKDVTREFQKFAQIPGFRVGRAPIPVLERKFQKEIGAEVQRKLIPQFFREAVAKEKLKVVSMPSIDEVNFAHDKPLSFLATVDVAPDFQLPNYKGLKVKKEKVEVTDAEVENSLNLIAEQQANFSDVKDRGLILGDFAVISFSGVCEGKPIVEISPSAKPLSENKQFWLLMAKDSFLPGFCEPLLGAQTGDKKEISVDFPKDFRVKELAERKATYSVEVLGIKEKKLPQLDDAFAKLYKIETIQEFREKIKQNMLQDRELQIKRDVRDQIVKQLLKDTHFDLPESVVNAEAHDTLLDIVRENRMRGIEEEAIREKAKELADVSQQSAKDKVRTSFILKRIAEEEKLQVKDEELQERLTEIAQQAKKSLAEVKQRLEENGEIESVREQILISHALDLLVSHAVE